MNQVPDPTDVRLAQRREEIAEFVRHWNGFVAAWRRAARQDDGAVETLVREALDRGIGHLEPTSRVPAPKDDFAAALALVMASGQIEDTDEYVRQHRLKRGTHAVRHHVADGWRLLHNPGPHFDLWSYWATHLDPTAEDVDPLLHWLVWGRHRGFEPVPPAAPLRTPGAAPGPTARRVCLFAAYDRDGVVDDYVVTYLRELSRHADVFYLADGVLEPGQLDKLADVTVGAWSIPHGRYDFGSFSMLARDLVGWERIDSYEELLLANDSCFLVHPLDEVLATMEQRPCDWWGLQVTSMEHEENYYLDDSPLSLDEARRRFVGPRKWNDVHYLHLSSYFLAFRRPVFTDEGFRWRLDTVAPQITKGLVVHKYEIGLSRYLIDAGFAFDAWLEGLHAFHPLYSRRVFDYIESGFPLIKRNFLGENPRRAPQVPRWRELLAQIAPAADLDQMEANIVRVTEPARLLEASDVQLDDDGRRRWVRRTPEAMVSFRRMDRESPSHEHWWAFPTDADGWLDPGQRAVLDVVRHDPSLHAVVLTRGRQLRDDTAGARLDVVPVGTFEGQEALVRCGVVVVAGPPELTFASMPVEQLHRFVDVTSAQDTEGLPRHDLLLASQLPPDLALAEQQLSDVLAGRPLVVFSYLDAPRFDPDWVVKLGEWAARNGVVIGVREPAPDGATSLTRTLAPLGPLGLQPRSGHPEIVISRLAAAVVTDATAMASDAIASGTAWLLDDQQDAEGRDALLAGLDRLVAAGFPRSAAERAPRPGAARRFVQRVRAGQSGAA
jgi:hypothetical protein